MSEAGIPRQTHSRFLTILFWVTAGSFVAALTTYAYVGSFARYMADDFCTAYELNRNGFLASQAYWYRGWTGRFSFTATVNLAETIGPDLTHILPPLMLGMWLIALFWTSLQFTALPLESVPLLERRVPAAFLIASIFLFVFLESLPNVGQVLYWQTGMLTYLAPLIGLTLVIGILARLTRMQEAPSRQAHIGWPIAVGVMTFIAGGFSDTFAALQVTLFTLAVIIGGARFSGRRRHILFPSLIAALIGALLAMALVVAAPGNAIRAAYFPPHPGPFEVIGRSTVHSLGLIYYWTTAHTISVLIALVLPALIVMLLYPAPTESDPPSAEPTVDRLLLASPLLALLLCIACFAPSIWAMSKRPPDRALSVPLFALLCATVIWGARAGWLGRRMLPVLMPFRHPLTVSAAGVILILLLLGPIRTAIVVASSTMPAMRQYAEQWDQRDQQLRAVARAGETVAEVEWMDSIVGLVEVLREPDGETNHCVASYYGLRSVKAR